MSSKVLSFAKITAWLSFHDDHILIPCIDFASSSVTCSLPCPPTNFCVAHIFSSSYSNYSVGQALQQLNSLIFSQVQSAWKKTRTFKNILIFFQQFCCRDTTIYMSQIRFLEFLVAPLYELLVCPILHVTRAMTCRIHMGYELTSTGD